MDIIINKKESNQVLYKIVKEENGVCEILGINYRIKKMVDVKDIEKAPEELLEKEKENARKYSSFLGCRKNSVKGLVGTVLHIDTDKNYLNKCVDLYKSVGIYVYPILSKEEKIESEIKNINIGFCPDVIVITGHDYFSGNNKKDINNYMNSKYFASAVAMARKQYPNSVIVAGACQSLYEVLIARGANFASSPKRKNIHVYDPAVIAINACVTSQKQIIDFYKMSKYIENFNDAFGGVETFGKMKVMY
ncbi:MAG: hypothetical protein E7Z76_06955 [Methanobrevibacter sp.]|nr:hypothetical protein [Methanobrevibacter sp.]